MGLVNLVISSIGKCIDLISFLLDLNFAIVHTLIRSVIGLITFVNNLPMLTAHSLFDLWNLFLFGLMLLGAAASNLAHGALAVLGSCTLALGGLVETLKMAGYLSAHLFLRGKEHLCRALLSVLEGCDIAVSLAVYFVNTVVNFVLIAAQNLCSALTSVWQAVSSPLQKVLELTLTLLTFLYSSLVGTTNILCAPCILLLDFLASLTQIFVSVFVLNVYGFLLAVAIAAAATAYLNPATSRQAAQRVVDYVNSVPGLRRASVTLRRDLRDALRRLPVVARQLQRLLRRLYLLERGLWRRLSHQSGRLGLTMRTWLHGRREEEEEDEGDDRVGGDGDPGGGGPRRDPPDGRAGDGGGRREPLDRVLPSSSTDRPLKKLSSSGKDGGAGSGVLPTADSLLSLLKEQEERKKCVICQDCTKTVVLLPCRHLCLCRDCTNIVLRQPLYQQNCPLCRHMILNTMDVYL